MKLFFKYFLLGWLGLMLSLSFPSLQISWLAVLVSWGYVRHGKSLALSLTILFAYFYSLFSFGSFWSLLIPYVVSLLFLDGIKKHFSLPTKIRLGITLLLLWSGSWWFNFPQSYNELIWGGVTLVAGFWIPPLLKRISYFIEGISPWRSKGTIIRDSAWGFDSKRRARQPFGFEKGF